MLSKRQRPDFRKKCKWIHLQQFKYCHYGVRSTRYSNTMLSPFRCSVSCNACVLQARSTTLHNIFLFFLLKTQISIRNIILSTARELKEQYFDVEDNLPVNANELPQLFFD